MTGFPFSSTGRPWASVWWKCRFRALLKGLRDEARELEAEGVVDGMSFSEESAICDLNWACVRGMSSIDARSWCDV